MKLTDLLDQIDRLDQQATEGPWTSIGNDGGGKVYEPSGYPLPGCTSCGENEATYEGQDAEFIALARTALPKLAEAVYHVLELLDVTEKSNKYAYEFGGNKSPSLVTTNEVRRAITDTLGDDDE